MIGIIVVAVVGLAVVAGAIWIGSLGNTQDPDVQRNGTSDECREACSDLQRQHNDLCVAIANEQEAEDYANTLQQVMLALAAGTVSVVSAALGTAALIKVLTALVGAPVAIAIVAGGLFIGALLALALTAVTAAWVTAQVIASQKRQLTSNLRNLKANALDRVQANCPENEAQTCISNLVPCS